MPAGSEKPLIVPATVCDEVSITEIVLPLLLAAYTVLPSVLAAIARGTEPTGTVATAVSLAVSITVTVSAAALVT